jgi:hypothetical protein
MGQMQKKITGKLVFQQTLFKLNIDGVIATKHQSLGAIALLL